MACPGRSLESLGVALLCTQEVCPLVTGHCTSRAMDAPLVNAQPSTQRGGGSLARDQPTWSQPSCADRRQAEGPSARPQHLAPPAVSAGSPAQRPSQAQGPRPLLSVFSEKDSQQSPIVPGLGAPIPSLALAHPRTSRISRKRETRSHAKTAPQQTETRTEPSPAQRRRRQSRIQDSRSLGIALSCAV